MKKSIEILKKYISEKGDSWKKALDQAIVEEEKTGLFMKLIYSIREDIISNNLRNIQEVEETISNDLLYDALMKYVKGKMGAYYSAQALRALAADGEKDVKKAVDCIFEQAVIRYNPQISGKYEEYGFLSKGAFEETISLIQSLSDFVVYRKFYITAAEEAIWENTRIPRELCRYIAGKIEENFDSIRNALILHILFEDDDEEE